MDEDIYDLIMKSRDFLEKISDTNLEAEINQAIARLSMSRDVAEETLQDFVDEQTALENPGTFRIRDLELLQAIANDMRISGNCVSSTRHLQGVIDRLEKSVPGISALPLPLREQRVIDRLRRGTDGS